MTGGSVQTRDIIKSAVVTGNWNTVTLTFGDSGSVLPLRRRQFRPPDRRRRPAPGEPPRELDLLVPEAGKLPLVGRKDIFAELQTWIADEVDISVHALIGRAGSGNAPRTGVLLEDRQRPERRGRVASGFFVAVGPYPRRRHAGDPPFRLEAADASGHRLRRAVPRGPGPLARPARRPKA